MEHLVLLFCFLPRYHPSSLVTSACVRDARPAAAHVHSRHVHGGPPRVMLFVHNPPDPSGLSRNTSLCRRTFSTARHTFPPNLQAGRKVSRAGTASDKSSGNSSTQQTLLLPPAVCVCVCARIRVCFNCFIIHTQGIWCRKKTQNSLFLLSCHSKITTGELETRG